jgi:hypothetical protein
MNGAGSGLSLRSAQRPLWTAETGLAPKINNTIKMCREVPQRTFTGTVLEMPNLARQISKILKKRIYPPPGP